MKAKDLRAMDEAALNKELNDLLTTQQLQNTNQLRATRRDIARVRTVLAQKAAAK